MVYLLSVEDNPNPFYDTAYLSFSQGFNYKNFSISFSYTESGPPIDEPPVVAKFELINTSNNVAVFTYTINKDTLGPINEDIKDIDPDYTYMLILSLKRAVGEAFAVIHFERYDPDELLVEIDDWAGGLRIKQIINASESNHTEYKTYDYTLSGYLCRTFPTYYTTSKYNTLDPELEEPEVISYPRLLTYASAVGGSGSPNSVSYKKVTEYNGTITKNSGKKITYFPEVCDEPLAGEFTPVMNYQATRAIILQEDYYKNMEGIYELKKTINYDYEADPENYVMIDGFRSSIYISGNILTNEDMMNIMRYNRYTIGMNRERLKKTSTWEKRENGAISSETSYEYDSKLHLNPSKSITILNTDHTDIIEEFYKYPTDYLPTQTNCNESYYQAISDCSAILEDCNVELLHCNELYSSCFDPFLDCTEVTEAIIKKTGSISAHTPPCAENMQACLSETNGYYDCIGNLYCGYLPCIINAGITYNICNETNRESLFNLYFNCNDDYLKAIYLNCIWHKNNELVQKITKRNGIIIENIKNTYRELKIDSSAMPIINSTVDLLDNDNILVFYDSIDSHSNIIQLTQNGKSSLSYGWGYDNRYLISKTLNSKYNDCAFTGFENNETNGWSKYSQNLFVNNKSFTGKASMFVNTQYGPTKEDTVGLHANNHSGYQASVWVCGSKNAYLHIQANDWNHHQRVTNVNGSDSTWQLLTVTLPRHIYNSIIDDNLRISVYVGVNGSGKAYFDNLRFHPMDAQMVTYDYEPLIGITSESDINNQPKKFEYDSFNRLNFIRDFEDNILKKYEYHYKNQ